MRNRKFLIVIAGFLVVVAGTFPLWRPLFVSDVVDEPFPELSDELRAAFTQMPPDVQTALIEMRAENPAMALDTVRSMTAPDVQMTETMPDSQPQTLRQGSFNQIDLIHGAEGTATLYQLADNSRIVRFENFRAQNGPDLHVYLVKNANPASSADLGDDYIDLGALKGNVGNQNYAIPPEADLSQYQSVIIYCVPFQVVFSVASLQ
jgi:hypothetical protein